MYLVLFGGVVCAVLGVMVLLGVRDLAEIPFRYRILVAIVAFGFCAFGVVSWSVWRLKYMH